MTNMTTEDNTFHILKYRRYTTRDILVHGVFIPNNSSYYVDDDGKIHNELGPAIVKKGKSHSIKYYIHGLKICRDDLRAYNKKRHTA